MHGTWLYVLLWTLDSASSLCHCGTRGLGASILLFKIRFEKLLLSFRPSFWEFLVAVFFLGSGWIGGWWSIYSAGAKGCWVGIEKEDLCFLPLFSLFIKLVGLVLFYHSLPSTPFAIGSRTYALVYKHTDTRFQQYSYLLHSSI